MVKKKIKYMCMMCMARVKGHGPIEKLYMQIFLTKKNFFFV